MTYSKKFKFIFQIKDMNEKQLCTEHWWDEFLAIPLIKLLFGVAVSSAFRESTVGSRILFEASVELFLFSW